MQTIIILNTIGLIVLFASSTILFIMLLKAYKHIKVLESKKLEAEERAEYHEKALKRKVGLENSKWFDFEQNRCVCCGAIIPEGRHICINCELNKSYKEQIK